ncbi:hypothetical protein U9M48_028639 [Paspalum notatum var. saurae]|uniref:Uncharacterized protein n=1 Tax=Paspalum notatum var. saurae TaxID=547442 RepID=A0AAQ3TX73_PASNO
MKNAFKKAKKAVSKAGQHICWSSSESGSGSESRHAASERMSISTGEPEEFQTSSIHRPILILDSQLVPRGQDEAKALRLLNQKIYALTKCFDEDLLVNIGMREEFNELEPEIEPGRNSISRVMTRAQRRRAEEQIRKANEDAQQPGAAPAWAHPSTPAWEVNSQGPSHSARYTGGELDGNFTALFGALDLQEHRTLGMMDSLADIQ